MSVFERSEAAQKALNNAVETEQKLLMLKDAVAAIDIDFIHGEISRRYFPTGVAGETLEALDKLREVLKELGVEYTPPMY